jgi:hypothetical protein
MASRVDDVPLENNFQTATVRFGVSGEGVRTPLKLSLEF